jgi:hypothetical protein
MLATFQSKKIFHQKCKEISRVESEGEIGKKLNTDSNANLVEMFAYNRSQQ